MGSVPALQKTAEPAAGLSPRRERFCQEYLIDLNATQAAIRAGYSRKTAKVLGHRLLTFPAVQARVRQLLKERVARVQITQDDVIQRLREIGFSNMGDYVTVLESGDPVTDFSKMDRTKWGAVQELTVDTYTEGRGEAAREVKRVKFKLYDPRAAVVDIGRHFGMWPNKAGERMADTLAELIAKTPDRSK